MIKLRIVDDNIDKEWDQLVETQPAGTLFQTTAWLRVLQATQSAALLKLGIYSGSTLVGIFPIFIKRIGLIKVAASPLVVEDTPYLGPVIHDDVLREVFVQLEALLKKRGVRFTRVLFPRMYDPDLFHDLGYVTIPKHTHVLDLTLGTEKIWKSMEGRCRTDIRKAIRAEVEIIPEGERHYLQDYWALSVDQYAHQGLTPPNRSRFYELLWDGFHPTGCLTMMLARHEGRVIAGALFVYDKERIYYLDGVSDKRYHRVSPNHLLQWETIRWATARGFRSYDFAGSDVPRFAEFKKAFGGTLTQYLCVEKATSEPVRILRDWYGRSGKSLINRLRFSWEQLVGRQGD